MASGKPTLEVGQESQYFIIVRQNDFPKSFPIFQKSYVSYLRKGTYKLNFL